MEIKGYKFWESNEISLQNRGFVCIKQIIKDTHNDLLDIWALRNDGIDGCVSICRQIPQLRYGFYVAVTAKQE